MENIADCGFFTAPNEIILEISEYLTVSDLITLSKTCIEMRESDILKACVNDKIPTIVNLFVEKNFTRRNISEDPTQGHWPSGDLLDTYPEWEMYEAPLISDKQWWWNLEKQFILFDNIVELPPRQAGADLMAMLYSWTMRSLPYHEDEAVYVPHCKAVVQAMNDYETNANIQQLGCMAIYNLANDNENRTFLGQAGCQAVVQAMNIDNQEIQRIGCMAIGNLAMNDENRKAGCDAVLRAMRRHIDHQEIQKYGCQAIYKLTFNNHENKKFLGKAECYAVLRAMTRHETNADIQKWGRKAIRQLAANNDELPSTRAFDIQWA